MWYPAIFDTQTVMNDWTESTRYTSNFDDASWSNAIEKEKAQQKPNSVATNLIDGDISNNSRWSAQFFPKSVILDLGSKKKIVGTTIWTYLNRPYQYVVEVSDQKSSGFQIAKK